MSDLLQRLLQKSGPAEKGLKFRTSWEGRFTPAGLIKSYIEVVFSQASGGKPPFPTCSIFARASKAYRTSVQQRPNCETAVVLD